MMINMTRSSLLILSHSSNSLSRCIGLSPAIEGCPTPSVCVEKCPDVSWEWEEGKVIIRTKDEDVKDKESHETACVYKCPGVVGKGEDSEN